MDLYKNYLGIFIKIIDGLFFIHHSFFGEKDLGDSLSKIGLNSDINFHRF